MWMLFELADQLCSGGEIFRHTIKHSKAAVLDPAQLTDTFILGLGIMIKWRRKAARQFGQAPQRENARGEAKGNQRGGRDTEPHEIV